jgi:hypothetical protein
LKLKVYIAAAWHRQKEMAHLAEELKAATGIEVTSRWLHEIPAKGSKLKKERSKRLWAKRRKMHIIVVGGHQPVFDYLPEIIHVRHLSELKTLLRSLNK